MIEKLRGLGSSIDPVQCTWLREYARLSSTLPYPAVEIGSYVGISTCYIGHEYKQNNNLVYAIDPHHGSPEHQVGGEFFDEVVFDHQRQRVDTLWMMRDNVQLTDLEETIIPMLTTSEIAARYWDSGISLLFIDGDHSEEMSMKDYELWSPYVVQSGYMLLHDVHIDRAIAEKESCFGPRNVFYKAVKEGFTFILGCGSLAALRRGTIKECGMDKAIVDEILAKE